MTIAALFVESAGVYCGLPGVDAWDVKRNALNYAGPHPVVAHPPCSRWCQLAHINQKRYGCMVGDDGGMFAHALECVRQFGGVLEHPAFTHAWRAFALARPPAVGWQRTICGGWVAQVSQRTYGHEARKLTWLYYVGTAPTLLDWTPPPPPIAQLSYCANHGNARLWRISRKEAARTPPAFRDYLLALARHSRVVDVVPAVE